MFMLRQHPVIAAVLVVIGALLIWGYWPQPVRALLAFWLTDETFAVVSDRCNRHPGEPGLRWFYLGSALFMYSFWQVATILGYLLVGIMIALMAYFIISGIKSGDKVQLHRYIAMLILFA